MPEKGFPRRSQEYSNLKIVACNIPELDLQYISRIVGMGIVPSRSEYVRIAIRNQINRDLEAIKFQEDIVYDRKILDPTKFIKIPGYNGNKPVKIIRRLE